MINVIRTLALELLPEPLRAFGGDFVFSVSRDFVRRCPTPLLLQPGTDKPHPAVTSAEIERLATNLEVQKDWRAPAHLAESIRRVGDFLSRHTPA